MQLVCKWAVAMERRVGKLPILGQPYQEGALVSVSLTIDVTPRAKDVTSRASMPRYGDTVPVTLEGKIATMLYALIGIPLVLLCLTNIGSFLATTCRFTWKHILHLGYILSRSPKRNRPMTKTSEVRVPITVSVLTMVIYILSGAIIFSRWENWTFLDGSYFCFITLSTIGFGDFVPGKNTRTLDSNVKRIVCALYLLFGLALLSMIFQLIQDSFTIIVKRYASFLGLSDKQIEKEMDGSQNCAEGLKNNGIVESPALGKIENGSENLSEEIAPNVQRKLLFLGRNARNLRRESCPENVESLAYKERLARKYSMPAEHHGKQYRLLNNKQLAGERRELEVVPESQTLDIIKEQLCQKYSIAEENETAHDQ
ncbi:TWiK of potassium channels protein 7 [Bulinus truncatus]|nr:TWiK of potassium channels protein 7 [Bulinus truncatus]